MPGLYKDEGIVLRSIKLGEADKIVTIYTRGTGKVQAVAKGIRKTKSKFGARLEPFTRGDFMFYAGRNLDIVTSAEIITSFDVLRSDYHRLTSAAALSETVDKITPDRERAIPIYSLLLGGLEALAGEGGPGIVPGFLVKILSLTGYHPHLSACSACGRNETEWFSPVAGGALCSWCEKDDPGAMNLGAARLDQLARLLAGDWDTQIDADSALDLTLALGRYAEHYIERPLKSLHALCPA